MNAVSPAARPIVKSGRVITADGALFRQAFNRQSFAFPHSLAQSGLFQISRLALAAERLLTHGDRAKFVSFAAPSGPPGTKFGDLPLQEQLAETVRQLASAQTWLKLSSLEEVDPEYGDVLRQMIGEIAMLSGANLTDQITWSALTVFLASPHITTPYHIDHECNFLFQVQGTKDVHVFDGTDRSVLSEREIEQFYTGDYDAATYRDAVGSAGTTYRLSPGTAVHHPPLAPHWIKNGDDVSVSVSVGFCLRDDDLRARVYQVNRILRSVGVTPQPPGQSHLRDRLKMAAIGMVSKPNPATRGEMLFSGIDRIAAPSRLAKRLRHFGRQPSIDRRTRRS